MALELRLSNKARATKDLDLACTGSAEEATETLVEACRLDIRDFFAFSVKKSTNIDVFEDNVAIRHLVTAELAGKRFEGFTLDIGVSHLMLSDPDVVSGFDFLAFAEIPPILIPTIPLAHHVAEKLPRLHQSVSRRPSEHTHEGSDRSRADPITLHDSSGGTERALEGSSIPDPHNCFRIVYRSRRGIGRVPTGISRTASA